MRVKLIEAITRKFKAYDGQTQIDTFHEVLKRISDTNLLAYAIDLGIDTDAVLSKEVSS